MVSLPPTKCCDRTFFGTELQVPFISRGKGMSCACTVLKVVIWKYKINETYLLNLPSIEKKSVPSIFRTANSTSLMHYLSFTAAFRWKAQWPMYHRRQFQNRNLLVIVSWLMFDLQWLTFWLYNAVVGRWVWFKYWLISWFSSTIAVML